jgi:hypothetical protein
VQCTLSYFPANLFQDAPPHILAAQTRLALTPDLDALQQRSTGIVARLANGQHSIQVNMRVDKRRREQAASGVDLAYGGGCPKIRRDTRKTAILDREIDQSLAPMQTRVADEQIVWHSLMGPFLSRQGIFRQL